ncbi:hypothetical protein Tco_0727068 [Tanacetum coccineum]|uniref:Zinc finger, CCHC-type n=1 Tax=Tanacetum coccineum TaxID=301880 RepID=A0ABQ4YJU3_9ASTR
MSVVYVRTTPILEDGGDDATVEQIRKRAKWDNDDYICRGLILNGMSDHLFDIYQNVESSKKLWDSLETKYIVEDASSKKFLVYVKLEGKSEELRSSVNKHSVVPEIANQYGNGNVVTAPAEGNGNGINGNPISRNSCRLLKRKKQGSKALKRDGNFIGCCRFMKKLRSKSKLHFRGYIAASILIWNSSDNAPVYDSDGSTEVPKDENCYDHDIFNMHSRRKILISKLS